jgi:hypothetical protein
MKMVSENTIIKSFERVSAEDYGARFYRVDLHFHTPASDDARGADKYGWKYYDKKTFPGKEGYPLDYYNKVKKKQEEIIAECKKLAKQIVTRFRDEKISLAAVTDHNSIGTTWNDPESAKDIPDLAAPTWYELIDDEAQELNKDRTALTILPGVEISTSDIHILAIFPPQKPRRKAHFIICDLLNDLGFDVEAWGTNKAGKTGVYNTIQLIAQKGGLPIIAHADAHDKALLKLYKINSAAMKDVLTNQHLSAVEIVEPANFEKLNRKVKKPLSTWIKSLRKKQDLSALAYFQGSDAHSLEAIAKRFTYVKMSEPSFPGLKLAVHIPSSRVRLDHDIKKLQKEEKGIGVYLYGMEINHPYFGNTNFRFNRCLNCIVGKLDSGKSTLFNLLKTPFTNGTSANSNQQTQIAVRLFIEKIEYSREREEDSKYYYYAIGGDAGNRYLYSIDKDRDPVTAGQLDWQQWRDLGIAPYFYDPSQVDPLVASDEAFNKFLVERFGDPDQDKEKYFNETFALPVFLAEETQQLLYLETDGNKYKLYLDTQWNRGKEKRVEFSKLDNSLKRVVLISIFIISETTGPIVIDAPEEYFNNRDIVDYLVPIIMQYKNIRQIILFTNHPLLAVNTDPENYIMLERKGNKTRLESGFSIDKEKQKDQLVNLVEGSSMAFNQRTIRYSIND